MRPLIALSLVACASPSPSALPDGSLHDQLAAEPARLVVSAATSTGEVTARRDTPTGWQAGSIALEIASGALVVRGDADGALTLAAFELDLESIALPASLIGKPAELDDVQLVLAHPTALATTWSDADAAEATATIALDVDWKLVVDGKAASLGPQHLAPLPIAVSLTGPDLASSITITAPGELWQWAGLLALDDLALELRASP